MTLWHFFIAFLLGTVVSWVGAARCWMRRRWGWAVLTGVTPAALSYFWYQVLWASTDFETGFLDQSLLWIAGHFIVIALLWTSAVLAFLAGRGAELRLPPRLRPPIAHLLAVMALVVVACGSAAESTTTVAATAPPTTPAPAMTTAGPTTTGSTSAAPTTATTASPTTASPTAWQRATLEGEVSPQCCAMPAIAPVSPMEQLPESGWPADGFYSGVATRTATADRLHLEISKWIPCSAAPDRCPPDPPAEGVYADEDVVFRDVVLDDELTVVFWPLDNPLADFRGHTALIGSGSGFAALLANLDAAFTEWVQEPYEADVPIDEIIADIMARGAADPEFPFGQDPVTSTICYRGPLDTWLLANPAWLMHAEALWPPGYNGLYDWWSTLEIRDGRPILYLHANLVAG